MPGSVELLLGITRESASPGGDVSRSRALVHGGASSATPAAAAERPAAVPPRRRRAPTASAEVRARYDRFKGGRRMWGHGVGRKVALTFDDGPHYQTTPRLLDHLDAFLLTQGFDPKTSLPLDTP